MYAKSSMEQVIVNRLSERAVVLQPLRRAETERRSEPRFKTTERAFMHTVHPDWTDRHLVKILDVSRHGLRIATSTAVPAGSSIRVQLKDVFVLGEVRYCDWNDGLYYVGILVQDVFEARPT